MKVPIPLPEDDGKLDFNGKEWGTGRETSTNQKAERKNCGRNQKRGKVKKEE